MMGIDYKAPGVTFTTSLEDLAVFDIDADGGFRALSGTTVIMELNSSGLWAGDKNIINTSGGTAFAKKQIVTISSDGTSVYTLLSTNAGKMHMVSSMGSIGTSVIITLPTSATGQGIKPGMYWDIYSNTTAADVIDIVSVGAQSGAGVSSERILAHHGTTDALATSGAISHNTSGPFWIRIMTITTGAAPQYAIRNFMSRNGATTASYFGFSAGSTALS
jgi:hypothetical protein